GAEVDLVGRAVVVTPRSLLVPGGQYTVVVSGLVALDGRMQAADVAAAVPVGRGGGAPRAPRAARARRGDARGRGGGGAARGTEACARCWQRARRSAIRGWGHRGGRGRRRDCWI